MQRRVGDDRFELLHKLVDERNDLKYEGHFGLRHPLRGRDKSLSQVSNQNQIRSSINSPPICPPVGP